MTKSEVVEFIAKFLEENVEQKYHDVPLKTVAASILETVESMGMKPPVSKFDPVLCRTTFGWTEE